MKNLFLTLALIVCFVSVTPASATIIYSGANQNVKYSQNDTPGSFSLFDSPGTWDDINLSVTVSLSHPFFDSFRFSSLLSAQGNYVQFAISPTTSGNIARLAAADEIDASATFSENAYKDFTNYYQSYQTPVIIDSGEFRNATGYAGIRMIDGDDIYYGWIQVSVTDYNNSYLTGTLIDWAYESTPGVGIEAGAIPEPSTALLLLGATIYGAAFLSRRRSQA